MGNLIQSKAGCNVIVSIVTFKDLKERVYLQAAQQRSNLFERLQNNHFGFGILKSTIKKISKQTEIAAFIILLINLRRLECQSNIHNTALPNLFEK
jgi:hypothetical protein